MSIFVGDTAPSKIFVGDTEVSKVFVGDTQVRPSGWKPGANTLCYLPLERDVLDYSGNNNNGTGNPANFDNQVANYTSTTGSTYLPYSLINTSEGTLVCWIWWDGVNNQTIINQHTSTTRGFTMWHSNGAKFGWESDIAYSNPVSNSWALFVGTWDSGGYKFYYNGDYVGNKSTRILRTNQNLYLGYDNVSGHVNTKLSKLIIENKARTAQEISDYYNQTKANYGL